MLPDPSVATSWLVNLAIIIGILAACYAVFRHFHPVQAKALEEKAEAEVAAVEAKVKTEYQQLAPEARAFWARIEQGIHAINAKFENARTTQEPPPVGSVFLNQYEIGYALGLAGVKNTVLIDKQPVWTGDKPPLAFVTVAPVAPATTPTYTRES